METRRPTSQGPRAREIVAVARDILEREGADGLSMRRIADQVGIRAPSIYNHLPDKQALEAALISDGFAEWADRFELALAGTDDAPSAFGRAYRAFAHEHPHLSRLMTDRPLQRDQLLPGVEDRAARPAFAAASGDPDRARALWAFAHGMTILELNGRFQPGADLDAAWCQGLAAFRPADSSARRALSAFGRTRDRRDHNPEAGRPEAGRRSRRSRPRRFVCGRAWLACAVRPKTPPDGLCATTPFAAFASGAGNSAAS